MNKKQNTNTAINKKRIATQIAETPDLSKTCSSCPLERMIHSIQKGLIESNFIKLFNFGAFRGVQRSVREGSDPRTGKKMKIPPTKYFNLKWQVSKHLNGLISYVFMAKNRISQILSYILNK